VEHVVRLPIVQIYVRALFNTSSRIAFDFVNNITDTLKKKEKYFHLDMSVNFSGSASWFLVES